MELFIAMILIFGWAGNATIAKRVNKRIDNICKLNPNVKCEVADE